VLILLFYKISTILSHSFFFSVCESVGVADRNIIPDARMTASTYSTYYYPYYGRLNEQRGRVAWCAKTSSDRTDYLQVDIGAVHSVCAVAIKGAPLDGVWTTTFKVHLSTGGVIWNAYKENNKEKVHYSKEVDNINVSVIFSSHSFCFR